jgi:hypothetical protein
LCGAPFGPLPGKWCLSPLPKNLVANTAHFNGLAAGWPEEPISGPHLAARLKLVKSSVYHTRLPQIQ